MRRESEGRKCVDGWTEGQVRAVGVKGCKGDRKEGERWRGEVKRKVKGEGWEVEWGLRLKDGRENTAWREMERREEN